MTLPACFSDLRDATLDSAPAAGAGWLAAALDTHEALDSPRFVAAWSSAGRKLGRGPLKLGRAVMAGSGAPETGWLADTAGRALMLVAGADATPLERQPEAVAALHRTGEERERIALVRALGLLPDAGRFAGIAEEAVRGSFMSVIEALACENPYVAAHLPELPFNHLVMKCVYNEIALARIEGLASRVGPELRRIAAAYASERRAAGRSVPADLDLLV